MSNTHTQKNIFYREIEKCSIKEWPKLIDQNLPLLLSLGIKYDNLTYFKQYSVQTLENVESNLREMTVLLTHLEDQYEALISNLLKLMESHKADYTNTFAALTMNMPYKDSLFSSNEFKNSSALTIFFLKLRRIDFSCFWLIEPSDFL